VVSRARRLWGIAVTIAAALAVVWPTLSDARDSFPLSTFPMFAAERGFPELDTLRGVTAEGERVSLPPKLLGTTEVMQARAIVARAAAGGKKAARQLCSSVAQRLASSPDFVHVQQLELSTDRYDAIRYFTESTAPIRSRIRARCAVPGRTNAGAGAPPDNAQGHSR
jgi:hypothetical protein